MLTILMLIKKSIKFLNSNESVESIAFSLTMALVVALIPFNYIFHPLAFLILIAFNGNLIIFLFMTPILSWITPEPTIPGRNKAKKFFMRVLIEGHLIRGR